MRCLPFRSPAAPVILVLAVALASSPARAQDKPNPNGDGSDPRQREKDKDAKKQSGAAATDANGQPRPPKLTGEQKTMLHIRGLLAAGDEEWAVLEPRIGRVMRLQREVSAGREPKGPRQPRTDRPPPDPNDASTPPVVVRARALNAALFDPSLPAAEIKARVAAVRDARLRVRQDLARAQDELRELLTYRQEATLIIMGMLE